MTVSLWSLLGGAFTLWAATMAVVVVLQRRSPAATIAWLLLLVLLPIDGWLVYRLIGPLRLERRKARRRVTRKLVEEATAALWEIEHRAPTHHRDQLARVAIAAGEAPDRGHGCLLGAQLRCSTACAVVLYQTRLRLTYCRVCRTSMKCRSA